MSNKKEPIISITISELIKCLEIELKKKGNVQVVMSSDTEGNSYSTISRDSFYDDGGFCIISPHHEHLELDEIHGYEEIIHEIEHCKEEI